MKKAALTIITCMIAGITLYAQYGILDPAFGSNGYVLTDFNQNFNRANSVAIFNDGTVVAAGSTQNLNDDDFGADFALAKYHEDGSPATDFGNNGLVITDIYNQSSDVAMAVAIQSDGKIVVAGRMHAGAAYEDYQFAIVRYNTDGTLDNSFGAQGKVLYPFESDDDYSYKISMVLQSDGKILVTGPCYHNNFDLFLTVRFNSDGQVDLNFGTNGQVITSLGEGLNGYPNAIDIQSDGKILVGGLVQGPLSYPTGVDFALVRYEPNGTLDATFGINGIVLTPVVEGSGYEWIEGLSVCSDGKIVVVGNTDILEVGNNIYHVAIVRYNSDGTLDFSFGAGGIVLTDFGSSYPYATDIAVSSVNDIIVGGNWENQNGENDFLLAKFTANGVPDQGFGINGITITDINPLETGMDLKFQGNGKIVAAGLTGNTTHQDFAVLRYLNGIHPGKDEITQDYPAEIFPNPVEDYLMVRMPDYENSYIRVTDIRGQQHMLVMLKTSDHRIDLSNLPSGFYFLMIKKKHETCFYQKLIKK